MDLYMKLFMFVYIVCEYAMGGFTEEQLELMKNLHNECVSQTGVDEAHIADCAKGIFHDDPKFKCYAKCIFDEMGVIQDDGTIDSEGILAMMPEDIQAKIAPGVRKCGTVVGTDVCDSVYLTNQCYYKEFPNEYFVI